MFCLVPYVLNSASQKHVYGAFFCLNHRMNPKTFHLNIDAIVCMEGFAIENTISKSNLSVKFSRPPAPSHEFCHPLIFLGSLYLDQTSQGSYCLIFEKKSLKST